MNIVLGFIHEQNGQKKWDVGNGVWGVWFCDCTVYATQ